MTTSAEKSVERKPLFQVEGRDVFRGDILYHRDIRRTSGVVRAEFKPECDDEVRVRTAEAGAVPLVKIRDLMWERHPEDIEREKFIRHMESLGYESYRLTNRDFEMYTAGRKNVK